MPGPNPIMDPLEAQPLRVLYAEDDEVDAELFRNHVTALNPNVALQVVPDGADALAYLRREDPYVAAPRPDVVVLDLHMPKVSGIEVLAEMKADPLLVAIPVIVLSVESVEDTIRRLYAMHAAAFVPKPDSVDGYSTIARHMNEFWLRTALLPGAFR